MTDDIMNKGKIHIRPKTSKVYSNNKEIEAIKNDLRNLKKQVGRLISRAESEEKILDEHQDHPISLKLLDGTTKNGLLKEITKFQIVLDHSGKKLFFYKSSISYYFFT